MITSAWTRGWVERGPMPGGSSGTSRRRERPVGQVFVGITTESPARRKPFPTCRGDFSYRQEGTLDGGQRWANGGNGVCSSHKCVTQSSAENKGVVKKCRKTRLWWPTVGNRGQRCRATGNGGQPWATVGKRWERCAAPHKILHKKMHKNVSTSQSSPAEEQKCVVKKSVVKQGCGGQRRTRESHIDR